MLIRRALVVVGIVWLVAVGSAQGAAAAPLDGWAEDVCRGFDRWIEGVDAAARRATVTDPSNPDAVRRSLDKLVSRAIKGTNALLSTLGDAGDPSVRGGKDAAAALEEGVEDVADALRDAKQSLGQASGADAAALSLVAAGTQATVATAIVDATSSFGEPELSTRRIVRAFASANACERIGR